MASTKFDDEVTVIEADWANDVNEATYSAAYVKYTPLVLEYSTIIKAAFDTGRKVILSDGTFDVSSGILAEEGFAGLSGSGMDKTIINATGTNFDILTVAADVDFIKLEGFQLTRASDSITHDGLVLASDNHNIYVERVESASSRRGFNSKLSTSLQNYKQCRADFCVLGFYANGLNGVGGGAGTTLVLDQFYATSCTDGILCEFINEVVLINPAVDNLTGNGIHISGCASTTILEAHFEAAIMSAAGNSFIRWDGVTSSSIRIDGVYLTDCTSPSGTSYAVNITSPPTNAIVNIARMVGTSITGISPYAITEDAGDTGLYIIGGIDIASFPVAPSATLTGGKRIDYSFGLGWIKADGKIIAVDGIGTGAVIANTNIPSGATVLAEARYDTSGALIGYSPIYTAPW